MFQDVAKIKERLDLALGERAAEYWNTFKTFVRGQVSSGGCWEYNHSRWLRMSLMLKLKLCLALMVVVVGDMLLTQFTAMLHNQFVLAIFQSAEHFPQPRECSETPVHCGTALQFSHVCSAKTSKRRWCGRDSANKTCMHDCLANRHLTRALLGSN